MIHRSNLRDQPACLEPVELTLSSYLQLMLAVAVAVAAPSGV
jgi:hypothetical protein